MKLTITIEDCQLDALKYWLRVKREDWGPEPENDYAKRILTVRNIMELSNTISESTIKEPEIEYPDPENSDDKASRPHISG